MLDQIFFLHQRTMSNIKGLVVLGLAELHCKRVRGKYSDIQRGVKIIEFSAFIA